MNSKPKLDARTCAYGAQMINKHRLAVENEIEGVIHAEDIEYIHRMRVATRRLRSTIPLFQNCFSKKKTTTWLSEIKKLTRALGEARDLDVQIEKLLLVISAAKQPQVRPGLRRLLLRLRQRRQKIQVQVIAEMENLKKSQLLDEMSTSLSGFLDFAMDDPYTLPLYQLAFQSIQNRLDILLACEDQIFDPNNIQELHQMRIEAKRLRYTLEVFAPIYPTECKNELKVIKAAQEMLGDIHDCDVWIAFLPRFIEEEANRVLEYHGHTRPMSLFRPGIEYFKNIKTEERSVIYSTFLEQWQNWKSQNIWQSLHEIISAPLMFQSGGLTD